MSVRVYYRAVPPDKATEILTTKSIPLTSFYDGEEKLWGVFVTRDFSSAYEWGLQLSYENGWNFFTVLELHISEEKVKGEMKDPVALYIPPGVDSVFLVINDEFVVDDNLPLDGVELVCPTDEGDLKGMVEDILVHSARGGWMENEWLTPSDIKILRNVTYRDYMVLSTLMTVKDEFVKLMSVAGGSVDPNWWKRMENKLTELSSQVDEDDISDDEDELMKSLRRVVKKLVSTIERRVSRKCWI